MSPVVKQLLEWIAELENRRPHKKRLRPESDVPKQNRRGEGLSLFLYSVSCEINGYREQRSLCSGAGEIHRIKLCHARPHEEAGTAHNPKSRRGASTRNWKRMSQYVIQYGFKTW